RILFGGLLDRLGIELTGFWAGPSLALVTVIIFGVWTYTGYNAVIFLAGLGNIPKQLYEAAAIDGATRVQQFRHITVPLLSPVTFYLTVLGFIGTFQAFTHIYVMRSPATRDAIDTASVVIFDTFYGLNNFSLAAAQSVVLFLIILILTLMQNRFFGRRVVGVCPRRPHRRRGGPARRSGRPRALRVQALARAGLPRADRRRRDLDEPVPLHGLDEPDDTRRDDQPPPAAAHPAVGELPDGLVGGGLRALLPQQRDHHRGGDRRRARHLHARRLRLRAHRVPRPRRDLHGPARDPDDPRHRDLPAQPADGPRPGDPLGELDEHAPRPHRALHVDGVHHLPVPAVLHDDPAGALRRRPHRRRRAPALPDLRRAADEQAGGHDGHAAHVRELVERVPVAAPRDHDAAVEAARRGPVHVHL